MILLDTDIFSLYMAGHATVLKQVQAVEDAIAITVITRIEVLQGRFASILKASGASQLQLAQQRLLLSENDLEQVLLIPINLAAATELEKILKNKKLKKIGRADLLIASIALAHQATLVTRNVKHFNQVPRLKIENWVD